MGFICINKLFSFVNCVVFFCFWDFAAGPSRRAQEEVLLAQVADDPFAAAIIFWQTGLRLPVVHAHGLYTGVTRHARRQALLVYEGHGNQVTRGTSQGTSDRVSYSTALLHGHLD